MLDITFARWRRAPVRLTLFACVLAAALGGFAFRPGVWLGVATLLLVNLLGQLRVVAAMGARPSGFTLGLRGVRIDRDAASNLRLRGHAWLAGAALQSVLAALVIALSASADGPFAALVVEQGWAGDAFRVLGATNLKLALVWSLPLPFLPGAEALLSLFLAHPDGVLHRLAVRQDLVTDGAFPLGGDADKVREGTKERRRSTRRRGRGQPRETERQRELRQAVKLLEAQVEVTRFLRDLEAETRDAARKSRKAPKN